MDVQNSHSYLNTKPHYQILNGLRGVAALMVIWYHIFEGFATSPIDQKFNHGYLAVDFFFILSGFVIGYAYDDRWDKMTNMEFVKRRLIRLHPMILIGAVFGLITFLVQGSVKWDGTHVEFSHALLAFVMTLFLIPSMPKSMGEVRGNGEIFPLDGPLWSLFFEYIANIFYFIFLRKFTNKMLGTFVVMMGVFLASFSIFNYSGYGHLGVGWTFADNNFFGGLLRVLFSYSAGLYISRKLPSHKIKGVFWICSIILIALFSVPYIGDGTIPWQNGIFDAAIVILVFPVFVYLGSSSYPLNNKMKRLMKTLGDISYPLYVVHYPFMYLFYSWLWKHEYTFVQTWQWALLLFFGNILLAYVVLKIYEEPVRKYLTRRFLMKSAAK